MTWLAVAIAVIVAPYLFLFLAHPGSEDEAGAP